MFKHNLLIIYRNFKRFKSTFFINLLGLSTGMACALLIYLWVTDELSMDKFHEKDSQLYQVYMHHEENGEIRSAPHVPALLADALEVEIPEVITAVEDTDADEFGEGFSLSVGEDKMKARGKFSGAEYFQLFSFPFLKGNPETALSDKRGIVLTESLAKKLFGSTDVIGESLAWQILKFKGQAKVAAVIADLTDNTTESFEFVLPFTVFIDDLMGPERNHWGNYIALTQVQLVEGSDVAAVNNKVGSIIKEKVPNTNVEPFFKQYSSRYLQGNFENGQEVGGRINYVRLFAIIAIFVLAIACINFMNLSTARASRRLKEIGVKKTMGASRKHLVFQHLGESISLTLISLGVAYLLVFVLLPQFNAITAKQLSLDLTVDLVLATIMITLFTGLLAGSYPALYLSGFKPVSILKGKFTTSTGELWTRKGLVVFQFVISIILLVSVWVVYKQIEYVQDKNLGYDRHYVIKFPIEGTVADRLEPFINQLKQVPGVKHASATTHSIVKSGASTTGVTWQGKNPDSNILFEQARAYYGLIETLGIEMKEGRSFSEKFGAEEEKIIFNEAAIKVMGLEDPIGKTVTMWGKEKQIIGVVKDFHFSSLHEEVSPMLFHFDKSFMLSVFVKMQAGRPAEVIQGIQSLYKEFNPGFTLNYEFLDTNYQAQYQAEQRVSLLSRYFAGIAIIISCLGLFGLAAFTAERRQKEIGIRKILGAGGFQIVRLLSADFTKIVLIAIVIALPISYWAAQSWLQGFAYSIEPSWYYFAGAGAAALGIAWITISFQTIKSLRINPADTLKDE
ncbi:FtsX-like permease family protein [Marivirga sericea]|uniref:FtsX-like permease family protein n=1 Tax=Marivirga sericea TaxID=1028 RepID=A0A1X7I156_9BACT|nr:ABC transporter permease [Marivirga sericea]SMG08130.1 FtsX-like permease family protein [Marivirga sericea]